MTMASPYAGGQKALRNFAIAGAAGLLLTAVGYQFDPQRAMLSYLVAFLYFLGFALGAMAFNMANYAARARWPTVLRRAAEMLTVSFPALLLLFVPIVLAARHLYVWVDPPAAVGREVLENIAHKASYLNMGWFAARAALYFAVWLLISELLWRWSLAQDSNGAARYTRRSRRWGAGGLPFLAFSLTFASFDWLMSLNPTWFSTIFGLYFFAGSFVASLSLLVLIVTATRAEPDSFGTHLTTAHFHSLGKLLLGFVAFWAYMAFSQYMLIWVANLPEEIPWFLIRTRGAWRPVGGVLVFGHFVIPFFALLSRDLKQNPKALSVVAIWLLVMHYVDLLWLVMPAAQLFGLGHDAQTSLNLHWTLVTAFAGVGGVAGAFALWRARGHAAVPVGDPYLEDSLRYVQP
jgi:hypothetical protein